MILASDILAAAPSSISISALNTLMAFSIIS